jgi:hypothetical protein
MIQRIRQMLDSAIQAGELEPLPGFPQYALAPYANRAALRELAKAKMVSNSNF